MSSPPKPIKLWGDSATANPAKVAIILEELQIPYEVVPVPFSDVKKPEYVAINPNGRLPSIHDPNTGITLWESGAIVEYLIETYDKERRLSFASGTAEFWLARQWLYFQVSGQGPYYGQAGWFKLFHPERLPSALDRYLKEIERVVGVLEGHLARQKQESAAGGDGPWLVGNKLSYADIAFAPWQYTVGKAFTKDEFDQSKYPLVDEWFHKIAARPAARKVWDHPESAN
ncbi:hypothetical protein Z517_04562 [Fonsecaea pedrosoi CBS 271.37]|uniref:Unplaced genomic scaffold supercont1.3, whole genome shotgun sequence n=1 Tax=Fonsecaea pedrosoi CBS 271.37 TaxID=1442368 RepID=A0A0D2DUT7_9EURO|nr:uncharacterized protein Z517_04562 [Fonsecaea pedrosoi CBS 271.37]KIW81536.1 hypothetical protein Z517_04562 [Fonsecaea pedrosoi CBS 271.37]